MITYRCKMCGAALNVSVDMTAATCEYCGTRQTLPRLSDSRRVALFERADMYRRNNEYDKANALYEQILGEDSTDAEAYWGLVLCKYGVEYVSDSRTGSRKITLNRTQLVPAAADPDYRRAFELADGEQREIYADEAEQIDRIQKEILDISAREEPFDVFICYKENDENGKRTRDSVTATELYYLLTREGYKVFFSRITLNDKLGTAYEPYIFAALHSARVMVVLGTKAEYFQSPWVRNEWSRYLKLIRQGEEKTLIPAYKDMDAYDLPEEFAYLQALNMDKLGFMYELTDYIKRVIPSAEQSEETVSKPASKPEPEPAPEPVPTYVEPYSRRDALKRQRNAYSDEELMKVIAYRTEEKNYILYRWAKSFKVGLICFIVGLYFCPGCILGLTEAIKHAGSKTKPGEIIFPFLLGVAIVMILIGLIVSISGKTMLSRYGRRGEKYNKRYATPEFVEKYRPRAGKTVPNLKTEMERINADLHELEEIARDRRLLQ